MTGNRCNTADARRVPDRYSSRPAKAASAPVELNFSSDAL
jgi:hypothetical protein